MDGGPTRLISMFSKGVNRLLGSFKTSFICTVYVKHSEHANFISVLKKLLQYGGVVIYAFEDEINLLKI